MSKFTFIIILFYLSLNITYGQSRVLKGQVVNENYEPIENAIIRFNDSKDTYETNDSGMFEITIDNQEKNIEAICLGYKTESVSIKKMCYVNVVMINNNFVEFDNANEMKKNYMKAKSRISQSYKKAINSGRLKKEQKCNFSN